MVRNAVWPERTRRFEIANRKGGAFKNIKLGKNVHRQMKRRGPPARPPSSARRPKPPPHKSGS